VEPIPVAALDGFGREQLEAQQLLAIGDFLVQPRHDSISAVIATAPVRRRSLLAPNAAPR
jgi:hypothetical protein